MQLCLCICTCLWLCVCVPKHLAKRHGQLRRCCRVRAGPGVGRVQPVGAPLSKDRISVPTESSFIRAVSMTIRFGTASSAIPLDFIDMYCFEYPTNLRYSRGVLNNVSIKEYTQPLRRCGCALVCKLCCQQAGTSNSSPKARNKQESSLHFCRYYTKVLLQASSKRGLKSTLILVRLGSRLQLSRMSPGKWEPSKTI